MSVTAIEAEIAALEVELDAEVTAASLAKRKEIVAHGWGPDPGPNYRTGSVRSAAIRADLTQLRRDLAVALIDAEAGIRQPAAANPVRASESNVLLREAQAPLASAVIRSTPKATLTEEQKIAEMALRIANSDTIVPGPAATDDPIDVVARRIAAADLDDDEDEIEALARRIAES